MPGTMTRRPQPLARNGARCSSALSGLHVALVGTDASPHVTGFAHFTGALHELLAGRGGKVSRPLEERPQPPGAEPDLVVAVLPGPGAAAAGAELADRHDVPLLVVAQGETRPPTADARTDGARLAAQLERRALARADRWAVTSGAARDRLVRLGVDAGRIDPLGYWAPEKFRAPNRFGRSGGFLVACPVGADTAGLAAVAAAAHRLATRGSDVQLVLVGRGPRLRALSASAALAGNVTVIEPADGEYPGVLAAADLVVLSEAAGRPDGASAGRLASGLAAGRPVLGAFADLDLLAAGPGNGEGAVVTVPPDRPEQLADAIDVLRDSPAALAVMASAARHHTRAGLAPERAAATLEAIVERTRRSR